jgi:predicted methyltransferase
MESLLNRIRSNVRLKEGTGILERILIDIYLNGAISTKELARRCLLPVPVVAAIKNELAGARILQGKRNSELTELGLTWLREVLGLADMDLGLFTRLYQEPQIDVSRFGTAFSRLEHLFDRRPIVDVTLDQSHCTAETSLRRAILGIKSNAVIGKKVLLVGDDDLVSLSICFVLRELYGACPIKTDVHVIDVDSRYLALIGEAAREEGFPVSCHEADLLQPIPGDLSGRFDSFFTDPPYTLPGLTLFASRGMSALKTRAGLTGFVSFGHKPPLHTLALHRALNDMGLVLSGMLPAFNEYHGAEVLGNVSQMLVLKTTEKSRPLVSGDYQGPIYTGQLNSRIRVYRCTRCESRLRVGTKKRWSTIRQLKQDGCPYCANRHFLPSGREDPAP